MRRDSKSRGLVKAGANGRAVRRRRVLQLAEQRSEGDAGEAAVPVQFLIAFVRAMIRNRPSGDLISLSMSSARGAVPITDEQAKAFMRAVLVEAENSPWPKGFF